MMIVRGVRREDLGTLLALAGSAGAGLTTLPPDEELLKRRISKSVRCMENIPDRPGGESYLFVLEDTSQGRVVGASGIVSKVGGFEPFYAYRVERERFDCEPLNVHKEIGVLHLVREHDGPAEAGSLYLSADYRGRNLGRFLQRVRFLFLAEYPEAFETRVVSELRGAIDERGHSAFWDAVGKHFFQIDFPEADRLSVISKKFIADLMPRYPIYVPMLPAEAREAMGKVHEASRAALRNLEAEGFSFCDMIDIFDGGPCVSSRRDDIRTVRESRRGVVGKIADVVEGSMRMIGRFVGGFRACMGNVAEGGQSITVSAQTAEALAVRVGDEVRHAELR